MKIAICQTNNVPLQKESLEIYFRYVEKDSVVVFGEYVFDLFLSELQKTSKDMIAQLSMQKLELLQSMAKDYRVVIIAPLITTDEKNKLYKQIAVIDSKKTQFYMQQCLIEYEHWNERKFFDNPKNKRLKTPLVFEYKGMRIGVIFGFEIHFDALWLKLKEENVDMVIMPTASALQSNERWEMLCRMRAFCNGCALLRVNRVGRSTLEKHNIEFYGESFFVTPNGNLMTKMRNNDEILCLEIQKEQIVNEAKEWGFRTFKSIKGKKK
ncbi:carbon-nitrogen hydrolase family protein [Helicobacter anatolicus]|uniref:carbon-nitrogen hydrolase family protein n=1 Tax=Helicobacter anatolicus TaxID=2905874 RepID=UPI001E407030|nr:carbon-nitrogen hydrolase family protein [Helicobacter anatolicus]MCE3038361.1 carbon-nitrogen hydrolase family protein [Helicobacter anatolicus]